MTKLTEAQVSTLEAKARNARDNARAERLVAEAFMEEYQQGLSLPGMNPTAEKHARSMELYDFAIRGEHRAKHFIEDAELFEACAAAGRAALQGRD